MTITNKNEDRKILTRIAELEKAKREIENELKELKEQALERAKEMELPTVTKGKTTYYIATIQVKNEPVTILIKETETAGAVDWQVIADKYNITKEEQNANRKPSFIKKVIELASDNQKKDLGL